MRIFNIRDFPAFIGVRGGANGGWEFGYVLLLIAGDRLLCC
jgi:hypothetical protein